MQKKGTSFVSEITIETPPPQDPRTTLNIEIRPYTTTYDSGARRRHTFTRYAVLKNGVSVDSGLTRRQAERLRSTLSKEGLLR